MNDLDPLLRDAMARVRRPVDARPSLTDVRRRARRRNRRRTGVVAGALACTGVAATALIVRRDASSPSTAGVAESTEDSTLGSVGESTLTPTTLYLPDSMYPTTTVYSLTPATVTVTMVWDALSAIGIQPPDETAAPQMPTPEQIGCTGDICRPMFAYIVWNEISRLLGFSGVWALEAANPNIDFASPPVEGQVLQTAYATVPTTAPPQFGTISPTTIQVDGPTSTIGVFDGVMLIDGGAPAGAMDDAYQRLAGFNRTIVPGTGKTTDRTMVMLNGDDLLAAAVRPVFNVAGIDAWDPSFLGAPIQGMVAVVIGPDYWDLVANAPASTVIASTTSIAP